MSVDAKISLASQLHQVCIAAKLITIPASNNAWHGWSTLFDCQGDIYRTTTCLLLVERAALDLELKVTLLPKVTKGAKDQYVSAIRTIRGGLGASDLHRQWGQLLSTNLTDAAVAHMETLDSLLAMQAEPTEIAVDDIDKFITDAENLRQKIANSSLDEIVKAFLDRQMGEVIYILRRYSYFGVDGIWSQTGAIAVSFQRFAAHMGEADYRNVGMDLAALADNLAKWLGRIGAVAMGADKAIEHSERILKLIGHSVS